MEPDRYKYNNKLYITGVICLILSLSLLFLSLYVAPNFIWNLSYGIPETVIVGLAFFQDKYELSDGQSKIVVWLILFIPSLITGFISYYISNHIDNQIFNPLSEVEIEEKKISSIEAQKELKESANLGFKILLLMIAIVMVILLLQAFAQYTA